MTSRPPLLLPFWFVQHWAVAHAVTADEAERQLDAEARLAGFDGIVVASETAP